MSIYYTVSRCRGKVTIYFYQKRDVDKLLINRLARLYPALAGTGFRLAILRNRKSLTITSPTTKPKKGNHNQPNGIQYPLELVSYNEKGEPLRFPLKALKY